MLDVLFEKDLRIDDEQERMNMADTGADQLVANLF